MPTIYPPDPYSIHSDFSTPPSTKLDPSNQSPATGFELAAQTSAYMGYLLNLLQQRSNNGNTALDAEIIRIYKVIQLQLPAAKAADPNATTLLDQFMSSGAGNLNLSALLNADGSINTSVANTALSGWINNSGGVAFKSQGYLAQLCASGQVNPRSATDPNTLFAYLMMEKALLLTTMLNTAGPDLDTLVHTSSNGFFSASTCAGQMCAAYAAMYGIQDVLSSILQSGPYVNPDYPNIYRFVNAYQMANNQGGMSYAEAFGYWRLMC